MFAKYSTSLGFRDAIPETRLRARFWLGSRQRLGRFKAETSMLFPERHVPAVLSRDALDFGAGGSQREPHL